MSDTRSAILIGWVNEAVIETCPQPCVDGFRVPDRMPWVVVSLASWQRAFPSRAERHQARGAHCSPPQETRASFVTAFRSARDEAALRS